ncbi:hypothetical protein GOP47_0020756 [Adiantum capillus-veneris]|uniref:Uncharacterized protein n=1 Tax=Adiantum capillus-veneris TaxID=13818 RepID=A0A9D4U9R5_ADICA|nr:hypothetical protein GOP47_0020756 [Adiantum capillus-veneris]
MPSGPKKRKAAKKARQAATASASEPKETAQSPLSPQVEASLLTSVWHQATSQRVESIDENASSVKDTSEIVQQIDVGDEETWREACTDHLSHKAVEKTIITKDISHLKNVSEKNQNAEVVFTFMGAALAEGDAKTLLTQPAFSSSWNEDKSFVEQRHQQEQDTEAAEIKENVAFARRSSENEEHCASCVEQGQGVSFAVCSLENGEDCASCVEEVQEVSPSHVEHLKGSFCNELHATATSKSTESMDKISSQMPSLVSDIPLSTPMYLDEENCNVSQVMLPRSNPPAKDHIIVPQSSRWWSCCGIFDWLLDRS